ncbi:MAG: hypothetical protein SOZ54_10505 [Candidatus Limiplasma sp.]|nr:hypothetical protein [Candidatus Limiplasma sp.]
MARILLQNKNKANEVAQNLSKARLTAVFRLLKDPFRGVVRGAAASLTASRRGLFCLIIAYPLQKTTQDAGKMCKITEKSSPAKPDWIFGLRMNQYLRLRAASAFFLRFTLGFS